MCIAKHLNMTAFGVALLALVLAAAPAPAQVFRGSVPIPGIRMSPPGVGGTLNPNNYYDPYGYSRQAAFNLALYGRAMSQVPPYALGYNPYPQMTGSGYAYGSPVSPYGAASLTSTGAYGSPGYMSPGYDMGYSSPYNYSYPDPYSGFLRGAADVINADGKFRINNQQANLLREQVKGAHIENRRRAYDEFLYERANQPTWLDDLERQRKLDLRYALNNSSGAEILGGITLNTLLDSLKQMQAAGVKGSDVAIDEDTLKKINVTTGAGANAGLLKNDGRLTWPIALTGFEFDEGRKNIERNVQTAVSEAEKHGKVDPARLKNLMADVDRMNERLAEQIGGMTPSQYIDARNYLRLLGDALKALSQPDAASYITGQYAAKGKTVGDLVRNMSGLRFAPATPGDERAYRDLYEKLVAYYKQVQPAARGE
jgi:hypothetical protein